MKNGNAINYYVKETPDIWEPLYDTSFNKFLEKNKFYIDGYFKKMFLSSVLWLLKKINIKCDIVSANKKNFIVHKYRIDNVDLVNLIKESKIDMNYVWRENPKYLIMGNDKFEKLTNILSYEMISINHEMIINSQKPSHDEYGSYNNRYHTDTMIWGFKIIVVPWIDGCFLLPNF